MHTEHLFNILFNTNFYKYVLCPKRSELNIKKQQNKYKNLNKEGKKHTHNVNGETLTCRLVYNFKISII